MRAPKQGNLAGPPARQSPMTSTELGKEYSGLIKFRLGHKLGATFFHPDILIGFDGTKFFIPSFFSPPLLAFNVPTEEQLEDNTLHCANFSIDVAAPRSTAGARIYVSFGSIDHVRSYADGAQLYRCRYRAERGVRLARFVAGNCLALGNNVFAVEVYHHTGKDAESSITGSGELWSSPWNLAGTAKVEKVAYTYFTTLPNITNNMDLARIGMSPNAKICYQTTSNRSVEDVLTLKVYREAHARRNSILKFRVPIESIAPTHLLFHQTANAYYECVSPEIIRVAVEPNTTLQFNEDRVVSAARPVSFDNIIVGDASTLEGLEAPMKEESTNQMVKIEKLNGDLDVFEFWMTHSNTDLYSGRPFTARALEKPTDKTEG